MKGSQRDSYRLWYKNVEDSYLDLTEHQFKVVKALMKEKGENFCADDLWDFDGEKGWEEFPIELSGGERTSVRLTPSAIAEFTRTNIVELWKNSIVEETLCSVVEGEKYSTYYPKILKVKISNEEILHIKRWGKNGFLIITDAPKVQAEYSSFDELHKRYGELIPEKAYSEIKKLK